VGDVGDVQAAGSHVGGNQHRGAPRAERAQGLRGGWIVWWWGVRERRRTAVRTLE
jgi:hypothetical protein